MLHRGRRTPTTHEAFSGPRTAKIAGISYRCLDYWARKGFIEPSVENPRGTGKYRLYSAVDILGLKVARRLREEGVSLSTIQRAVAKLGGDGSAQNALARHRFFVRRGRLFVADAEAGTPVEVSANGQLFFGITLGVLDEVRITPARRRRPQRLATQLVNEVLPFARAQRRAAP